jgi:hypothetical protein
MKHFPQHPTHATGVEPGGTEARRVLGKIMPKESYE